MEGWAGLISWPTADTLPTKWSHVNHRSGIDQGKSANWRPDHWATPPMVRLALGCTHTHTSRQWFYSTLPIQITATWNPTEWYSSFPQSYHLLPALLKPPYLYAQEWPVLAGQSRQSLRAGHHTMAGGLGHPTMISTTQITTQYTIICIHVYTKHRDINMLIELRG